MQNRVKDGQERFERLQGLEPEVKAYIKERVEEAIIIVNENEGRNLFAFELITNLGTFFVMGLFLIMPFISGSWLKVNYSVWDWILCYAVFFTISTVGIYTLSPRPKFNIQQRNIWYICLFIIFSTVSIYLLYIAPVPEPGFLRLAVLSSALGFTLFVMVFIPLVGFSLFIWRIFHRTIIKNYAIDFIIVNLLDLAYLLQSDPTFWNSASRKRASVEILDSTTILIQRELPRALWSRDNESNLWQIETCQKISSTFRQYKRIILLPTTEGKRDLSKRMLSSFLLASKGEWGAMELSEPVVVNRRHFLLNWLKIIRAVVIGLIPSAVIRLASLAGLPLTGTALDVATFVAIFWFVVTVLEIVDPDYNDRLNSLKTIKDIFTR